MDVEQGTSGALSARTVTVNGTQLRVEEAGSGAETVVFAPALFANKELFDEPVAALSSDHRCIRYDHRGQGESGLGGSDEAELLGVEGLYDDAVALLDELGIEQCHWVGASVGGFVGLRVAARHPDRVRSLVLIGLHTRRLAGADLRQVRALLGAVRASRWLGPLGTPVRRFVTWRAMHELLGRTFMTDPKRAADRELWRERFMRTVVPEAAPMLGAVLGHPGTPPELLARVEAPTLIIAGEDEIAAMFEEQNDPLEAQRVMPDARMATVAGAGHMVLVEQPRAGTDAITAFIRHVEDG